ncbi:MAG: FAD-binding protein [Gemmatimonadetes bacterium]|nr:FAD-binding protein [Gemmatimonadota bacterium]
MTWRSWAGDVVAAGVPVAVAHDLASLRALVRRGRSLRIAGAGHSCSALVPSRDTIVQLRGMDRVLALDVDAGTARVEAGARMGQVARWLAKRGWCLRHIGSSSYPTVGGALATAVHGSGRRWGSVSSEASVTGLTLLLASGEMLPLAGDRPADQEFLAAARTHLGALGVVLDVTLRVERGSTMRVTRERRAVGELSDASLHLGDDHVEAWWMPYTSDALVVRRTLLPEWPSAPGGSAAAVALHRILGEDLPLAAALRVVARRPGLGASFARWITRASAPTRPATAILRWDFATVGPRWLRAPTMEFGLPAAALRGALSGLATLAEEVRASTPFHLPVNIRWVGADRGTMLSMAEGRDTVFVEVPWHCRMPGRDQVLPRVEALLLSLGGRPHWGKLSYGNPWALYPERARWAQVRSVLDPAGVFSNDYLDRLTSGRPLRDPIDA